MHSPKIVDSLSRRLVGIRIQTSLAADQTFELWKSFKPRVKEIENQIENVFYSVQRFEDDLSFEKMTPFSQFEKWAAVEVRDNLELIPAGMQPLIIPAGKYAIFIHKGEAREYPKTVQYIFGKWMPKSDYKFDNRPQFEVMNENYRPDDPNAEEEVWIPIIAK